MNKEEVENVLKNIYYSAILDVLDNKTNLFIAKVEKTSEDVWGNVIQVIGERLNGEHLILKENIRSLLLEMKISDKAIRCSNITSLINLLNDEIEQLIRNGRELLDNFLFSENQGLNKLFSCSKYLYGNERASFKELNPICKNVKGFNPIKIQEIIDDYNDEIDLIICSSKTKRDYEQYLIDHFQNIERQNINEIGYFTMFNNSIPIMTAKLKNDEIYLINTKDFKMHQLCDWLWLEDSYSKILRQFVDKPIYKAVLSKYANLICKKPYKQIKVVIKEQ